MASILNNSSFIFNPAGSIISYQEDKVYSVLPNDGTVDGVVGGNSGGGTRVNQQGYIESVPANFMLNSGTTWTPFNVTVTTGVTDPVGGTRAYNISGIASGNITDYGNKGTNAMSLPAGTVITFSISMKGSGTIATYLERAIAGTYWFDVKVHTLSSEWQVFTHSYTVPTDASGVGVYVGNATGTTATSVDIAFPMLNYGLTAKPYQPTTDRLGYPPIDYKNGKGKLLQEPQRTNLTQGSNGLITNWTNYRGTYTANAISSPDGTVNATLTVWDGSSASTVGFFFTNFSFAGSTKYCFSVFLKYYNKPVVTVGYVDRSGPFLGGGASFNLANGTFISVSGDATTGIIEPYKDGWYRCTVVFTTAASPSYNYLQIDCDVDTAGEGFYAYGTQLEVGGFPTSYIPTTSATVTRAATDVVFYSPGPTKAFASKPGIILYDFDFYNFADGASYETFLYNAGSAGSDYFYFAKLAGTGQMYWDGNNSSGYFYAGSFVPKQGKNKVAWYFTNTNSYWYVNGSLLYTGTYFDALYFTYMQTYAVAGNNFAVNTFASIPDTSISQAQVQAWTNFNSGSGGTISYSGPYTIHTFTGSATFTPSFNGQVEVLVVAGGGGGGCGFNKSACGGGGGAGGLQYVSSYGVSAGTGITVTVGAGGAGGPAANVSPTGDGSNGSNSVFGGITTIGGGGGTTYFDTNGKNGGSGGGAGGAGGYTPIGGQGIPGQGNNGGNQVGAGQSTDSTSCGGGGGAGAVGANGVTSQRGGNGGIGLPYSISGFSTYYAGGGGGGASLVGGGFGGLGGGANGGNIDSNGSNAVSYTGGGGGGASSGPGNAATGGGTGGSGIVIVRYLT
jgi:hypothetical protein